MRHRVSVLLGCTFAVAGLAGCDRAPDQAAAPASLAAAPRDAAPRTGAATPAAVGPSVDDGPAPSAGEGTPPPGAWALQESDPPRAAWGAPDSESVLGFGCDRARGKLVLEREAVGVADDVRLVTIDADGTRVDYPAERVDTTLAPQLVVRIALDATIVDRLLGARHMSVAAGGDTLRAPGPGGSLRAVVDACRRGLGH